MVSGEGDFCLEFLLPIKYPQFDIRVLYKEGYQADEVSEDRISDFFRSIGMRDDDIKKALEYTKSYFNLSESDFPLSCSRMLELIYGKASSKALVIVQAPGHSLESAFLSYCNRLEQISFTDWRRSFASESARITLGDKNGGKLYVQEGKFEIGQIYFKVAETWLKPEDIIDRYKLLAFTGERSIIRQFEHGLPSYIPWYVRGLCTGCPKIAFSEIPSILLPIYSRDQVRRHAFSTAISELPWGLLIDIFNFEKKLNISQTMNDSLSPISNALQKVTTLSELEERFLRSAARHSVGLRRKRSSARDLIDGFEQFFSARNQDLFDLISSEKYVFLSIEFATALVTLTYLRRLRRALFLADNDLLRSSLDGLAKIQSIGDLSSSAPRTMDFLVSCLPSFEDIDFGGHGASRSVKELYKKATKDIKYVREELRSLAVSELLMAWDGLEAGLRATPYKVFALMPFVALRTSSMALSRQMDDLCLICCRGQLRSEDEDHQSCS